MMLDLDYFKKINDTHGGHAVGDGVLQAFVKRALESLRQSDIIGRIGGEEFAVIMPETALAAGCRKLPPSASARASHRAPADRGT